jgi:hypothetical protein
MFMLMKALPLYFCLALAAFVFNAPAQVNVDLSLDQQQFLPGESVPVTVHITNHSGQTLHLGANSGWLAFFIEAGDGLSVNKKSEPDVIEPFDLGSSEMAVKRVDLAPYFSLNRVGHFKVSATVHIQDWNMDINSTPQTFDLIQGAELWSQDFGVPNSDVTNAPPRVRKYTLIEANYLRDELRLYVQVTDPSSKGFVKVRAIGPMISFSQPEAVLDASSNLHVLYQDGASAFKYTVINPDCVITEQTVYDYVNIRPRLHQDDSGAISVLGGIRRVDNMPLVKSPAEVTQ